MGLLAQFLLAATSFLAGATQHVGDTCLTVKGPPPIIITVDNSVIGTLPTCLR